MMYLRKTSLRFHVLYIGSTAPSSYLLTQALHTGIDLLALVYSDVLA